MRISKIELTDVGPFAEAVFEIPPPGMERGELVLFEGPNGCGKSTIIEAIAAACALGSTELTYFLRSKARGTANTSRVSFESSDDQYEWGLFLHNSAGLPYGPVGTPLSRFKDAMVQETPNVEWAAFAYRPHADSPSLRVAGPKDISWPALNGAVSLLQGAEVNGTSPTLHRLPARGYFGQFLTNLESERTRAVAYAQEHPPSADEPDFVEIARQRRAAIERIEHVLSRFLDRRVKITFTVTEQSAHVTFDGVEIPLDQLGEGMRSSVAWLADLMVRLERVQWADAARSPLDQDFWLILDEIDESLHPTMQARIFPTLRELFPNARIYATTHSPFVVASLGEGVIFPIRPDPKTRRVSGLIEARKLSPGQSLDLVVTDIFEAHAGIVDEPTRNDLAAHQRDIRSFRSGQPVNWEAFATRREKLFRLNDEVRTLVVMAESPVRADIEKKLAAAVAPRANVP